MPDQDPAQTFIHLRLHTEFSVSDGLVAIDPLIASLRESRMPAVAVTDLANLFSLIKFYQAARRAGIKPICGCDLRVIDEESGHASQLALLVRDETGYRNLINLISDLYVDNDPGAEIQTGKRHLAGYSDGLIALSGAQQSDIAAALLAGKRDLARQMLESWQELFPQAFYLELQRLGKTGEEDYIDAALELARECACPVVATNDVRFLGADDFEAHEARVCISQRRVLDDSGRPRDYSERQYLRGADEMVELFADIPEAIQATLDIACRCNLDLELEQRLPEFPLPEGETASLEEYLAKVSEEGLRQRLSGLPGGELAAEEQVRYYKRLQEELDTINQMDFAGYFLIVMEFVQWAKNNGIPVGPGRGSGAGSVVAWALGITDLDPIEYDLLFERFLNPERVSMPDFDIDFCMEGRDRVIAHVADIYGEDAVSQIITFGTMAAKAVVRDVARVQGKPYSVGDRLSRLIPPTPGMTLARAMKEQPDLKEYVDGDEDAQEILEMAYKLEGITRNVGKHAGGLVIAPGRLTDFTPLYRDHERTGSGLLTQYDKDDVETAGLVKFDFLGLRTLTIIDWAVKSINEQEGANIDIARLPLDDEKVYRMLGKGGTTAVFQLESRGIRQLIRKLKPNRFDDMVALVALYRPGPLQSGMVDDFIDRKHGRTAVSYLLPELEPMLNSTYGVILYQEQVMKIAQVLGKYTLGGADILRKAMGKKDPEEMAAQRENFMKGAQETGVPVRVAKELFDLMEKFAGYGFNKSHSVAYALLAYQTAWLKTHYPAHFMAAVLSAEMKDTDKIMALVAECREMGLEVLPPNINKGLVRFSVDDSGRIVYGLGAIRNLGEVQVERILAARKQAPFKSLPELCRRTFGQTLIQKSFEILIDSGACDNLAEGEAPAARARLRHGLPAAFQAAEQHQQDQAFGISGLFGGMEEEAGREDLMPAMTEKQQWDSHTMFEAERECLGFHMSGHPVEEYLPELARIAPTRLKEAKASRKNQTLAGMLADIRVRRRESGNMGILTIDDGSARLEAVMYDPEFRQVQDRLQKYAIVVIEGRVVDDEFTGGLRIRAKNAMTLDEARTRHKCKLALDLNETELSGNFCSQLASILEPYRRNGKGKGNGHGYCKVIINYHRGDMQGCIMLGPDWAVAPADDLVRSLRMEFGRDQVMLRYDN
ncbi:MAG: DNA polymerase III subunit alpha [Gammaproteobacteria bacterium]|nr:DNA polymerase III subunit alpha [Gammaproteobacteria bacterium]MYG96006.1 DNA polymerase III subunit alpha [Gammaproteobacteria bacterium]